MSEDKILIVALAAFIFWWFFSKGSLIENLALQKVQRGVASVSRSNMETTTFTDYVGKCIGGDGKKKWSAFSPSSDIETIKRTPGTYGVPHGVEMVNNRQTPFWLVDDATCPVDGIDGDINSVPYSTCSAPCGSGTKTRTMPCKRQPKNGGKPCTLLVDKQPCNTQPCPIHGVDGPFGSWSACSKTCGSGTQTRTLTCAKQPLYGGNPCSFRSETQVCNTQPCPVDGVDGPFGSWTTCTNTCGGGTQTRTLTCAKQPLYGGKPCSFRSETQICNTQPCTKDCPAQGLFPASKSGAVVTTQCPTGKSGSITGTCGVTGVWSISDKCTDIICATRDGVAATKYGSTSVGVCPAGTVGSLSGTCGADGLLKIDNNCKPGVMGRYIKLLQPNPTLLHIAELQVFSNGVNVAAGVPGVKLSSIYSGSATQGLTAVDQNLATYFQTKGVGNDSLEIDLGKEYPINSIVVYNRWDDMNVTGRIAGSILEIRNNANTVVFTSNKFVGKDGSLNGAVYKASNGWYKYTISPPSTAVVGS